MSVFDRKKDIKTIGKFLVSGGSAALVEYTVFTLLHYLGVELVIANTTSFLSGFIVSFTLNRSWVFASKGKIRRQLLQYSTLAFVNLLLSNVLMLLFVSVTPVPSLVAKLVTMVAIACWNYLLFSRIIFKDKA